MEDDDYVVDDTNLGAVKDAIEALGDPLEQINASLKEKSGTGDGVWAAIVWAAIVVIAIIIAPSSWAGSRLDRFTDRAWCSQKYDADWSNIDIQKRPTDCDFMHHQSGPRAVPTRNRQMFSQKKSAKFLSH